MPEVFASFDTGIGTLNIFDPTAASGDPALFTAINQLAVAQGDALTQLALGSSLRQAQETAFRTLQRPLTQFGNPFNAPAGTSLISAGTPTTNARFLDLGSIGAFLDFQTVNQFVTGAGFLSPTQLLVGEARQKQALLDRQLAESGQGQVRNPFLSLQRGPFVPCSSDDPRGRCLTPAVRRLQADRVAATAQGRQ